MSATERKGKHPHMEIVIIPIPNISNIIVEFPREKYLSDRMGGHFFIKRITNEDAQRIKKFAKIVSHDRETTNWVVIKPRKREELYVLLKFEVLKRGKTKPEIEWILFDAQGNEVARGTIEEIEAAISGSK